MNCRQTWGICHTWGTCHGQFACDGSEMLGVAQKLTSLRTYRPTTSMRSRTGTDSCSGGSDVVLFVIGVLRL